MPLIRFYIFSILFFSGLNEVPKDRTIFVSPVKIPQYLSANFGELRVDHFHSGIDIKTQGATGKEVIAAANGFISRISITNGGFGNALYITHPSGYSTVYGHLERFTPAIDKYVRDHQYEKKSFQITIFPSKEEFPVKQGEIIAYSGNSGSSGGPHLHFEIRKSESEKPINPLLFDFGTIDKNKPVIDRLVIYPEGKNTLVNNEHSSVVIKVSGSNGGFSIPQPISISGLAGFGIKTYDIMPEGNNRCAVYSINVMIDSTSVFDYVMDGFAFDESRYVNSHIDYETFMKENVYYERLFKLPGDRLSVYKHVINRGLFNFNDGLMHNVKIVVTDASNNQSVLRFRVKSNKDQYHPKEMFSEESKVMPYNKTNNFSADNIMLKIPEDALYDTLNFIYKTEKGTRAMFSDIHCVQNRLTPIQKPFTISIKPSFVPSPIASKMLIVQLIDDIRRNPVKSSWTGGYLSGDVMSFGKFYIGADTTAPLILANGLEKDSNLSGRKEMKVRITDDLSGIKSYEGIIDGKWALFEYDQKNEQLTYRFDETRITKKTKHTLVLKVTDNKDNVSEFNYSFTW